MADYYTAAIIQQEIPAYLITEAETEFMECFGFNAFVNGNYVYFATENYSAGQENEDGEELYHDDLVDLLQAFIKSCEELKYITIEMSFSCSKLRPDGFGGAAHFITCNGWDSTGTSSWLSSQIQDFLDRE